jgi:cyclohexyl-isocyanide hydratase
VRIGFLVFPGITQLDLTGPAEVLFRLPGARIDLLWKTTEPVRSSSGLLLTPTACFQDCDALDILCVPGGFGIEDLLDDREVLEFLVRVSANARYVTSVCTGSLLLGAAGLLRGKRATTHWAWLDQLEKFGATPSEERVVIDGNVVTGGGVTAGIDFALTLLAEIAGRDFAEEVQLALQYDPRPPFTGGTPRRARPEILERVSRRYAQRHS